MTPSESVAHQQRQGTLWEGIEQKASESQWYTRPKLACRIAQWVLRNNPGIRKVLEPSAGEGALIKPFLDLSDQIRVYAVELDPINVEKLRTLGDRVTVIDGNFLNIWVPRADIAVMNPPYEHDQDVRFIMRALEFTDRVVALLRGVVHHGLNRWNLLWRYVDIVREANFIERPKFGGSFTPMQDYVLLELVKRKCPRERGESMPGPNIEWW